MRITIVVRNKAPAPVPIVRSGTACLRNLFSTRALSTIGPGCKGLNEELATCFMQLRSKAVWLDSTASCIYRWNVAVWTSLGSPLCSVHYSFRQNQSPYDHTVLLSILDWRNVVDQSKQPTPFGSLVAYPFCGSFRVLCG